MQRRLSFILAITFVICIIGTAFAETKDPRFPAGTMGEPEGTIAVVSVYAHDAKFGWDLDQEKDQEAFQKAYDYLGIAVDYLTKEIGKYGKKVKFVWDWNDNEDLLASVSFQTNLGETINNSSPGVFEADELIKEHIDTDAILKSTKAKNIIYLFFINSDGSESNLSCSFWAGVDQYDSQKDYYYMNEKYGEKAEPYEFSFIFMGQEVSPAIIAHEMLHTFALPDLYGESTFGVTEELVDYLEKNKVNDIMQSTKGKNDKITAKITDITAYYMGLIDKCDLVQKFNLRPSSHSKEYANVSKVEEAEFVEIPMFNPATKTVTFFNGSAASEEGGAEPQNSPVFKSKLLDGQQVAVENPALSITAENADEENIFPVTLDFAVSGNNNLKISAALTFDDSMVENVTVTLSKEARSVWKNEAAKKYKVDKAGLKGKSISQKELEKLDDYSEIATMPYIVKAHDKKGGAVSLYNGVLFGIRYTVTATKSKGEFDANEEKIIEDAFKTSSNYVGLLLNMLMEDED